jgi:hypothetical protein
MPDTYVTKLVQCRCGAFYLRRPAPPISDNATGSFNCEQCGFVLGSWRGGFGVVVFERAVATKLAR